MDLDFLVPNSIQQLTGGSIYDRMIIQHAKCDIKVHELYAHYPFPRKEEKNIFDNTLQKLGGAIIIFDGLLIYGFTLEKLSQIKAKKVCVVHLPITLDDTDKELIKHEIDFYETMDHLIVTSGYTKEILHDRYKVSNRNISVIHPGVNPFIQQKNRLISDTIRLLYVANFVKNKGYIELFVSLGQIKTDFILTCIGSRSDSKYFEQCNDILEKYNLGDKVIILEEVPYHAIHQYYENNDIYISTSKFETYGMGIADAIYAGLPVVSTKVGALSSLIPDDVVYFVENTIEDISNGIKNLIVNDEKRRDLSTKSLEFSSRFDSWEQVSNKFIELMERMAND